MNKLKDKVMIVTGASKGIGAEIAKAMAKSGAKVVVNYSSDKQGGEAVAEAIIKNGGIAIAIQGDMSKASDVKNLFEKTETVFGTLDVLVNNAGVYKFEPIETVTEEEFHREFNTNVLGPILTIQEAIKYFGNNGGSIINISSIASTKSTPFSVVYSATKSAVNSITGVLSKELGSRNIRVNSILPGLVETEGTHKIGAIGSDNEKYMNTNTSLGRTGQPADIAKVAVFLASEESAWITGENIAVSGGLF
jgi:3-oxoacyl-[acyl-carrier protein] reductase